MIALGYLVFGDVPNRWTLAGVAVVIRLGALSALPRARGRRDERRHPRLIDFRRPLLQIRSQPAPFRGPNKWRGNLPARRHQRPPPERRHRRGDAAQALPLAIPPAAGRAARLRPVPAEPREGHQPPLARAGGDRGGLRLRDEKGRPHLLHLSRPRAHARARRAGRESARRADAARQRPDARQGRLDAPHLRRARRDGLLRDHRRASADRLRRGAARAIQGRQGRHGLLLRRRHDQYRRVPRGAEFRRDLEAAGGVRVREQSLHGIHADRRHHGGASIRPATAPPPTGFRRS